MAQGRFAVEEISITALDAAARAVMPADGGRSCTADRLLTDPCAAQKIASGTIEHPIRSRADRIEGQGT
jgi:hypothetical protein